MGTRPARIVAGAGDRRRGGASAAGSPGRAGKFVLAAAAGLALAFGAVTGTTATHAAAAVSARAAVAVHALPMFEPCPCADPPCRPVCFQSAAPGGPATAHPQPHLAAAVVPARAGAAVHALSMFDPCPCTLPICRPGCFQGMASGGPTWLEHRYRIIHLPEETS